MTTEITRLAPGGVGGYSPLHDPEKDGEPYLPPLDTAMERAREILAETQSANIHDRSQMITAASRLYLRLESLVAAVDADAALCSAGLPDAWRKPVSA